MKDTASFYLLLVSEYGWWLPRLPDMLGGGDPRLPAGAITPHPGVVSKLPLPQGTIITDEINQARIMTRLVKTQSSFELATSPT
jgi:hypothetical protein